MKVLLLVLLAVVAVNAQFPYDDDDQVTKVLIDDFSVGGNVNSAVVTLQSDLTTSQSSVIVDDSFNSPGCSGLIGCGRDLRMEATSGFAGRSFDSEIFVVSGGYFVGEWAVANPKTSSSIATIQYDGQDGSFTRQPNGLNNLDVTAGGETTTLKFSIISDLDTTYTITLRDVDGRSCSASIFSPAISGAYEYFDTFIEVPFPSGFNGNCDFTNIGNIEVTLPSDDAVDAIVRTIQFTGPPATTPSNTPTPSPSRTVAPTGSNTPTPSRTPSRPPTASPTPSPSPVYFTWYTFDDDDNGVSPCGDEERRTYFIEDNNIIYYYFYGVEHPVESSSSASILSVGIAMFTALFLF